MALKINNHSDFDTISWDFVLAVLEAFSFCSTFRDLIASIF